MMTGESANNTGTILLVSPHPDDEIIGAGATAITLRESGHKIVNLACSLGKPEQHKRRRGELEEACGRAGIELIIPDRPALISSSDDLDSAQQQIRHMVSETFDELNPQLVIMPSVHDGHHGHEVVARATREALAQREGSRLWMYNIWGELPHPTVYSPFEKPTLDRVIEALDAYKGENDRNDYRNMVIGRALLGKVLGSEKVFGFGSAAASDMKYAELFTEVIRHNNQWLEGPKRVLNSENLLAMPTQQVTLDKRINSTSPQQRHRDR